MWNLRKNVGDEDRERLATIQYWLVPTGFETGLVFGVLTLSKEKGSQSKTDGKIIAINTDKYILD